MLKQVRDKVLQPSNVVRAFAACGMHPFNFAASYAYKQVPPPKGADHEDEWTDIEVGNDDREESNLEAENEALLDTVTTSAMEPGLQRSSHSSSHSNSQNNFHSSTPDSQSSCTHAEHLRGIDTQLALLTLDATPHHVAADEPPHQIHSYTLLFSLFLCSPYIVDLPLRTSALMQPCSHNNCTRFIGPISLI